ncbi:MAG: FISUMP domain-containing protein [Bacteroidota bacterium]
MKTGKILIRALFIASLITQVSAQQSREERNDKFFHTLGTFTDPRDGEVYKTITFVRELHSGEIRRTWYAENVKFKTPGSRCYKETGEYCNQFGRLYNYEQANLACPKGWHVPTIHEWKHLFHFFGGWHYSGKYLIEGKESDMDMLFGGFGIPGGGYKGIGVHGNWWDNELKDSNSAGIITLKKNDENIYHSKVGDDHYLSCRCVKFHN